MSFRHAIRQRVRQSLAVRKGERRNMLHADWFILLAQSGKLFLSAKWLCALVAEPISTHLPWHSVAELGYLDIHTLSLPNIFSCVTIYYSIVFSGLKLRVSISWSVASNVKNLTGILRIEITRISIVNCIIDHTVG